MKFLIALLSAIFLFNNISLAQEDPLDEFQKKMNQEFENYSNNMKENFETYRDSIDKLFANAVKKYWEDFEVKPAKQPKGEPKPKNTPKVDPKDIAKDSSENIPVVIIEDTTHNVVKDTLVLPVDESNYPKATIIFNFYGKEVSIDYDKTFITKAPATLNENAVGDYWGKMSDTKHYSTIEQLTKMKDELALNDWGYFMLVKSFAEQLTGNEQNGTSILTWFLLQKSGYRCRVGYSENNLYLLLPSKNMIYGKNYFMINQMNYYVSTSNAANLRIVAVEYPQAKKFFDLLIDRPLNFPKKPVLSEKKAKYFDKNYNFYLTYEDNLTRFLNDYPSTNLEVYFNSEPSSTFMRGTKENIGKYLSTLPEFDQVSFLLGYIQNGFKYKTDPEQFGKEKFFFVEEILRYPFCDCEDRAIYFSWLVRKLLDKEVIGLVYPGHVAAAVKFNSTQNGDFVIYNNEKYIVCDPTYIGAPVGMSMPEYKGKEVKVIQVK